MTRSITLVVAALAATAHAEPPREVPDYDGRGNPDARPSEALWIPRALLSPLYVVHEYVVRRPLGALVKTAEHDQWVSKIEKLLGTNQDFFIYPRFAFDFGSVPSAGASLHWRHALASDNTVTAHVGTWGVDWVTARAEDTYRWDTISETTRIDFVRRSDNLFVGIGPDVTNATRARYGIQRFDGSEALVRHFANESALTLVVGTRASSLRGGTCCGDPLLSDLIGEGVVAMPPGYDPSHLTIYERAALRLDSRRPRPAPGTGAYIELHGEDHVDVHAADAWLRYGGEAGVAVDLDGRQRNLKLLLATELVDPVGSMTDIPFYELAQLGGDNTMSGFLPGWMNGRSVATAGVAYTWPVWALVDGQARVSIGNAFGEHLSGFSPAKLRLSADLGLTTVSARTEGLQLIVGIGTETFEQGARITSVRVAIGSRRGF